MEVLYDIFKIMLCVTGILVMFMIIVSIIITPFIERKKKKERMDALQSLAEQCMKEITEEYKNKAKEEKETKKTPRKTKKKEEI